MAISVEVAGLIGTWVGAGVGVIALFALVGPLLIWLASRTDRQKTLNAIGRDNNRYISPGWHLGPNIYLWQRVRAPLLQTGGSTALLADKVNLDISLIRDFDTKTTWVKFGALLSSYGFEFSRGDSLVIDSNSKKSFLPTHPSWVLAVGLLGRYSSNEKRWRNSSGRNAMFHLSTHGRGLRRLDSVPRRPDETGSQYSDDDNHSILYGITGSMKAYKRRSAAFNVGSTVLVFQPRPIVEFGEIAEVLSLGELFLLSMGFLHLGDQNYASLMHFSTTSRDVEDASSGGFDDRLYDDEGVYEREVIYDSARERPRRWETRPTRVRVTRCVEREESPPPPLPITYGPRDIAHRGHAIFRLNAISIADEVIELGHRFLDLRSLSYCGLTEISDSVAKSSVREIQGNSYVPADAEWVRIASDRDFEPESYLFRADAQQLALALLNMRWHPAGYLIGGRERGPGMDLLTAPSKRLPGLMNRLLDKYRHLSLSLEDQQKLQNSLHPAARLIDKTNGAGSQSFRSMYKLDETLGQLCSRPDQLVVDQVIGILCLTNPEFLELVYQSIRNLRDATNTTVQLDMRSTTLRVPSVFGVTQHFPVDMDRISPIEERNHGMIDVSYTIIILAALRSLLKSRMLDSCLDADPLLEVVDTCEDLVLIH